MGRGRFLGRGVDRGCWICVLSEGENYGGRKMQGDDGVEVAIEVLGGWWGGVMMLRSLGLLLAIQGSRVWEGLERGRCGRFSSGRMWVRPRI